MNTITNLTYIGTELADLIKGHMKSIERTHPNIESCSIKLKSKGIEYWAKLKGRYELEAISGEATGKTPLKAYLKANKNFNNSIERVQTRKEIEEAMADYPVTL